MIPLQSQMYIRCQAIDFQLTDQDDVPGMVHIALIQTAVFLEVGSENGDPWWCRIQSILGSAKTDPSMAGALPPGAWWEYASEGKLPPEPEPYGNNAGKSCRLHLWCPFTHNDNSPFLAASCSDTMRMLRTDMTTSQHCNPIW